MATKPTGGGRAAAKDRAHDYVKAQVLNGADVTSGSVRSCWICKMELQRLTRHTWKVLQQDLKTVREHGKVFRLPEGVGGDDAFAATAAVQKLRSRILADDLRAVVGDFVALCNGANTTAILIHKDDPPEELDALLDNLVAQLGPRHVDLVGRLGGAYAVMSWVGRERHGPPSV